MSTTTYDEQRTEVEKQIDEQVMKRVKRGIALLERRYGQDWVEHIDLDLLDLKNAETCVLGQLFGNYSDGLDKLWSKEIDDQSSRAVKNGFFAHSDDSGARSEHWRGLQTAWERALNPVVKKKEEA